MLLLLLGKSVHSLLSCFISTCSILIQASRPGSNSHSTTKLSHKEIISLYDVLLPANYYAHFKFILFLLLPHYFSFVLSLSLYKILEHKLGIMFIFVFSKSELKALSIIIPLVSESSLREMTR